MNLDLYRRLARDGNVNAKHIVMSFDWDPDQPRDPDGKFGSGGGSSKGSAGSGGGGVSGEKNAPGTVSYHHEQSRKHEREANRVAASGNAESKALHETAARAHVAARGALVRGENPKTVSALVGKAQEASARAYGK